MKTVRSIFPFALICCLLAAIGPGCTTKEAEEVRRLEASFPQATTLKRGELLEVGAAEIDITPPIGHRMAGYFDERLSTGIHDPLKAKAIVVQQGREQIAMVFCDLVGFALNVTTNARAQVSRLTGIPVANIVICATHSHTGPLFDDTRRHYFHETALAKYGADPREKIYYPAFLTAQLVKVIGQAQKNLRPATLEAG